MLEGCGVVEEVGRGVHGERARGEGGRGERDVGRGGGGRGWGWLKEVGLGDCQTLSLIHNCH